LKPEIREAETMSALSTEDARQKLHALPDWEILSGELVRTFPIQKTSKPRSAS